MRYYGLFFALLVMSILCSGCGGKQEYGMMQDELRIMQEEPDSGSAGNEKVGVYVDVTPSMDGFLGGETDEYKKLVEETNYFICLGVIDKIISIKYNSGQITGYRMDTPLWKTEEDENVLYEAKDADYYKDSEDFGKYELIKPLNDKREGYDNLCLTSALLISAEDDFAVIVTDFFENDKDAAGQVIEALKGNMGSKNNDNRIVGIIGVKSQYAGTVYDITSDKNGIAYGKEDGGITEDDIVYRPFYIIVAGKPDEVRKFCDDFLNRTKNMKPFIENCIFYEENLYGLDYTDFERCYQRDAESQNIFLPGKKVLINGKDYMDIYRYKDEQNEEKEIVISYRVEGELLKKRLANGKLEPSALPEVSSADMTEISYSIENKEMSVWDNEKNMYLPDKGRKTVFSIEKVYYSPEEELIYMRVKLFNEDMPEENIKLSCHICIENTGGLDWEWAKKWNMEEDEIDCGKTMNLTDYFSALEGKMPEKNNVLLDFTLYLDCT